MLPRRCKKCRCYVAPQLKKCPRCGTVAPAIAGKPTKEEKLEARATQDSKVPVVQGKNIHWVPSVFALKAHADKLHELARLLDKANSAAARNAIRSEVRITKAFLSRKVVPAGKKAWTTEALYVKDAYVTVYISPKKHRYVLAERDNPADLVIIPTKKNRSLGPVRLVRFEKSPLFRKIKKSSQEEAEHKKRKKVKKEHRKKKRLLKRSAD